MHTWHVPNERVHVPNKRMNVTDNMRGYFALGVEGISKPMNLGNVLRSAHAFGASWVFTVRADFSRHRAKSDTTLVAESVPYYRYDAPEQVELPQGCELIGVELTDAAVDLPSFRHPRCAAYVLGPERGTLSAAMIARCDHVVKIPTRFCINVGVAGAIVMYDRMITIGRFAERPVSTRGKAVPMSPHVFGAPLVRDRDHGRYKRKPEQKS